MLDLSMEFETVHFYYLGNEVAREVQVRVQNLKSWIIPVC